jgi:hypothetical protein
MEKEGDSREQSRGDSMSYLNLEEKSPTSPEALLSSIQGGKHHDMPSQQNSETPSIKVHNNME